jgi:DNA-binding response OmpR family regulator
MMSPAISEEEGSQESSARLRLAIVDDNEDLASSISLLVSAMGHSVEFVAHDGGDIVDAVTTGKIDVDLIVMDYSMPKIDGLRAARMIREFDPSMRIIIVSADDSVRGNPSFLSQPGLGFLQKPFLMRQLRGYIASQFIVNR